VENVGIKDAIIYYRRSAWWGVDVGKLKPRPATMCRLPGPSCFALVAAVPRHWRPAHHDDHVEHKFPQQGQDQLITGAQGEKRQGCSSLVYYSISALVFSSHSLIWNMLGIASVQPETGQSTNWKLRKKDNNAKKKKRKKKIVAFSRDKNLIKVPIQQFTC
jgi:hypothetical protein